MSWYRNTSQGTGIMKQNGAMVICNSAFRSAGIVAAALTLFLWFSTPARATSCPLTITSCGCTMDQTAVYQTNGSLASASASVDCIDITAQGAVLVLAGDISGPGGGVTADGIHVMTSASRAFISGSTLPNFSVRHSITGFATGVQVDAANVEIDLLNVSSNVNDGVLFNSAGGGDFDDANDVSHNGGAGVRIKGGSSNIVSDSTIDNNGSGVIFQSTQLGRVTDSEADENLTYGFWLDQTAQSHIKDSGASNNGSSGMYLGCQAMGGPTGTKCANGTTATNLNRIIFSGGNKNGAAGIGIDLGSLMNIVDGSAGSSNTMFDADDANKKCDHNIWFADGFGTRSQSCIH